MAGGFLASLGQGGLIGSLGQGGLVKGIQNARANFQKQRGGAILNFAPLRQGGNRLLSLRQQAAGTPGGPGILAKIQSNLSTGKGLLGIRAALLPGTQGQQPAPAAPPAQTSSAPQAVVPVAPGTSGNTAVFSTNQRGIAVVIR